MPALPRLAIILGSTRQGRYGERVAQWVHGLAKARSEFDTQLVDLLEWPLPFFKEPGPPVMLEGRYENELMRRWVALIAGFDVFVIVTPEYNHSFPAVLKNALDITYAGWNNKPVAFVSYGGFAGGARAVEQLRLVAIELQLAPIRGEVNIPMIRAAFDEQGQPKDEMVGKRATGMFDQLAWWAQVLKEGREKHPLETAGKK